MQAESLASRVSVRNIQIGRHIFESWTDVHRDDGRFACGQGGLDLILCQSSSVARHGGK